MNNQRLSRRTVLRGLGSAMSLPLLDAMLPVGRLAAAAGPQAPLRTMYFMVPNGAHMPAWTPTAEGPGYALSPTMEPLAKHREYISVFSGLTLDGARAHEDGAGDHARSGASFLTGAHPKKTDGADIKNSVSVDQVAAQVIGSKTRFASLELGLEGSTQAGGCDSGYSCAYSSNLAWRNENSPLPKENDPAAVFDRLFGNGEKVGEGKSRAARIDRRKSVLDFVQEDAKLLHKKLGVADQRKMDEYLYAVREVENRLSNSRTLNIGQDGIPNIQRPTGIPKDRSQHCKLMLDMVALAIRSDSTRVLTFGFANEGNNWGYPEIGAPEGHHDLSHHGKSDEKQAKIQKINLFHMQHFAYLLDHFADVEEAGGKLLDNCMILYGSGISDGDRHNHDDLPIIMAGKAGGKIKKASHWRFPKDTPLCDLYLWMLNQSGVKADSFGDSKGVLKFS